MASSVIYVTHDQAEAMVMSDRIIVMEKGKIQQSDVPRKIYERPANKFVADFIGLINFIDGRVVARRDSGGTIELANIPGPERIESGLPPGTGDGDRVTLAVRPENISLSAKPSPDAIKGRLVRKVYLGNEVDYRVSIGPIEIRVTTDAAEEDFGEGGDVWLTFKKGFAFAM